MRVNQSILVTDENSEHAGRAGIVNSISEAGVLTVMLDADPKRAHAEVELRAEQVKAL